MFFTELLFSLLRFSRLPRDRELDVPDALLRLTPGTEQFMNGRPGRQFAQTPPSHEPRVFTHKVLAHRPVRCCKQLTRLANLAISVTSIGQSRLMTASGSACLDIWPRTFEGDVLDCNGRREPLFKVDNIACLCLLCNRASCLRKAP